MPPGFSLLEIAANACLGFGIWWRTPNATAKSSEFTEMEFSEISSFNKIILADSLNRFCITLKACSAGSNMYKFLLYGTKKFDQRPDPAPKSQIIKSLLFFSKSSMGYV